ncbi:MAG: IPT/TIG domain-containing protein [Patescibacteria group bacterium]
MFKYFNVKVKYFFRYNKILFSLFLIIFCIALIIPIAVNIQSASAAVNTQDLLNNAVINQSGLPYQDLKILIMKIINIVLGFLGIIAIILIIYAGLIWMTAHGDEEKIKTAKKILIDAVIGLAIVLSAFIIVSFILKAFLGEGETPPYQICTPSTCTGCHQICNAQGTGSEYTTSCTESCAPPPVENPFVVKWVDPKDTEKDVALCRAIQAGFNDELNENTVNANNILIKIKDGKKQGEICDANKDCASDKCEANQCVGEILAGIFTATKEVFQFRAEKDFEENTAYQVEITTNVKSKKNIAINSTDLKRKWVFATGTLNDTTPPKVSKVYPENNQVDVCLAAPVEAIFNEPMDVISLMNENALSIDPVVMAGFNHNINNADTLIANPNEIYQKNKQYIPLLKSNIIADSCGNFLDGNGNGIAEKSPIDDYAPPPKGTDPDWSFTTGTQPYCKPEITNITSNGYYDGNEITISGNYFTITGEVIFNNNVYSDSNCFDSDFYPSQICVSNWADKQIKLKIPAIAGASNGAINGQVLINIGEFFSNNKEFTVLSPHINWISPEKGGKGQYVTLSGVNFGTNQGEVYLVKQSDHKIKIEAEFPCANSWTNNQVIIKIPETIALGEYYLQIKTNDNHFSNINNFIINNNPPGPGICNSIPSCGMVGTEVILSGERFGNGSNGKVYFGDKRATTIPSWSETQIKVKAPTDIKQGNNPIKIILNQGQVDEIESNALNFQSPCGQGDSCDINITTPACEPGACSENFLCNSDNCICQAEHCFNGQEDEDETDIDCGGNDCDSCGNIGDNCDNIQNTPSCQPNNSMCNYGLICRVSDCTCQERGQEGDQCDSNTQTAGCQASNNKCLQEEGFTCNPLNCFCTKKPFIISISPENGKVASPVTTYVTIRGGNFGASQGLSKVYFGDTMANIACLSWSDTEIIAIAPFGITNEAPVKVVVNQYESNNDKKFTVNSVIKPSICSLSPNHGKAGDKIIISGTNFGDFQMNDTYKSLVLFDNIETEINSWSNEKIEIIAPQGITITNPKVKIILKWEQAPNGTPSNEVSFYMDPFISGIFPDKGPIDTYVTIRGGNFGDTIGKVTFNGIQANLAPCQGAWSDQEIIVLAPNSSTGIVVVEVSLPNDTKIESNKDKIFTYNNEPLAPGICLDKKQGNQGDLIKIAGNKFNETQIENEGVVFNQVDSNVSLTDPDNWTNYQIDAPVPQTSSGNVVVTKIGQRDTGKKECVGGIYIFNICVGGIEKPIMEDVILNSNPVWFKVTGPACGNNIKESNEICDGTDLNNTTCSDFGLIGNGLKCKIDCSGFDTNQCQGSPGVCGDQIINQGETCDGNNFNEKTCADFDQYKNGNLICDNNCQLDYSNCRQCDLNSDCSSLCCKENQCVDFSQCQTPPIAPHCTNQRKDEDETGIDCGGDECPACVIPSVQEKYPTGNSVCINKEISATFNQLMDKETLNSSNIFLKKGNDLVNGVISYSDENNKTTVVFSSANNLDKNIEYQMTIKKEVKNRDGLTMASDAIWTFTTGSALCQMDHVKITINGVTKNDDLFTCADDNCLGDQNSAILGNQHTYIAQAQDKDNENISASYAWEKQDLNGILLTIDSKTNTQLITSQRKNGDAIVLVQADATGMLSKSGQVKVKNFMCEHPWNFQDSANEVANMGFELFYCGDR